jgi:hypothetical protein
MMTYRFAVHANEQHSIGFIDGLCPLADTVPHENEVIFRPSIIDPLTKRPIPVRVVEVFRRPKPYHRQLVVVVSRVDRVH